MLVGVLILSYLCPSQVKKAQLGFDRSPALHRERSSGSQRIHTPTNIKQSGRFFYLLFIL